MSVFITVDERDILQAFSNDPMKFRIDDWITDHLACRGLLCRKEKVKPLNPYTLDMTTVPQKAQRAKTCTYGITQRGQWALQHARLQGAE